MASEWEKMTAGERYRPDAPELVAARLRCQELLSRYNALSAADDAVRGTLLRRLAGSAHETAVVLPPVRLDYGVNLHLGRDVFVNYDLVALDPAPIRIGDGVLIGPRCQLLTALHPVDDVALRRGGVEWAAPITIEEGAWLAAGVIVNPGVTIGAGSVVGSGSVVTRDVPAGVFAAGQPARVVRRLAPSDCPPHTC